MIKPMTKVEREAMYERAKRGIDYLLSDPNNFGTRITLEAWFKWNALSHEDQLKILTDWDKYYEDVKRTPSYMIFQEQREASRKGNLTRVKELAQDARKIKENKDYILKKPTSIDPWEFSNNEAIKAYEQLQKVIKELTNYPDVSIDEDLGDVFK